MYLLYFLPIFTTTILLLAANPKDNRHLRLDEEIREIEQAISHARFGVQFKCDSKGAVRLRDLLGYLEKVKPAIVHFSGHGSTSSEIVLVDEQGNSYPVPKETMQKVFSMLKGKTRCVVLNACYADPLARAIAENLACVVVGISGEISDPLAIEFARTFYEQIANGKNISTAFQLAITHIPQDIARITTFHVNPAKLVFVKKWWLKYVPIAFIAMLLLTITSMILWSSTFFRAPLPTTTSEPPTSQPVISVHTAPTPNANEGNVFIPTYTFTNTIAVHEDPASQNKIIFAFENFPSYFPVLIADVDNLLGSQGYELELVPLGLDNQNEFDEEERFSKLQSGEWDILATTLSSFALHAQQNTGAITAVVDESAGIDKLVARSEISTVNDLRGRNIVFVEGSASEFFLYYALNVAGISKNDVKLKATKSVASAVQEYISGASDAVSAWEPDVLEAEGLGSNVLIDSDDLRSILDVLVTSGTALDTKANSIQAFHDAWFRSLKIMIDDPNGAENSIIKWKNNDWTHIGITPISGSEG